MLRTIKNLAFFGTGTAFGSFLTVFIALRLIFTNRHTKGPAKEIVTDTFSLWFQRVIFDDVPGYRSRCGNAIHKREINVPDDAVLYSDVCSTCGDKVARTRRSTILKSD